MKVLLFMIVFNGPLVAVFAGDLVGARLSLRRSRRALARGHCARRVPGTPGGTCGRPIAARVDVYQGYEYRFEQWVCHEHATDAERRARGRSYRVDWIWDDMRMGGREQQPG